MSFAHQRSITGLLLLTVLGLCGRVDGSTFHSGCLKTSSQDADYYVTADPSGEISAIADECRGWEVFELEDENGGELSQGDFVYVKTAHGKYLTATPGGELSASVEHKQSWERFQVRKVYNDHYTTLGQRVCDHDPIVLMSKHGLFISAAHGGGGDVLANGPYPKTWERLQFEPQESVCSPWTEREVEIVQLYDNDDASQTAASHHPISSDNDDWYDWLGYEQMAELVGEGSDEVNAMNAYNAETYWPWFGWLWNPDGQTLHQSYDADNCLEVEFTGFGNLDKLLIQPCTGDANQRWLFPGDGTMRSALRPNTCMTHDANDNGAFDDLVHFDDCDGSREQQTWRLLGRGWRSHLGFGQNF